MEQYVPGRVDITGHAHAQRLVGGRSTPTSSVPVPAVEAKVSGVSRSRFRPAQMDCSERRPMLVIIGPMSLRPPRGSIQVP
jgi:hypothetical protein